MPKKYKPTPSDKAAHKEMMDNSYYAVRQQAMWTDRPISNLNRGPVTGNARRPRKPQ